MFAATRLTRLRHDTSHILSHWILPLGWLALLTGMFWVGDRSDYHRLFYILLAAPTLLFVIIQPQLLRPLTRSPLLIAILAFSAYMMLSLLWSTPENSAGSLFKRPLYIVLLLFCVGILALQAPERLRNITWLAALGAVFAAAVTVVHYHLQTHPAWMRLSGYGALYNPLLSAHVYGAFTVVWLVYWMQSRHLLAPLPLLSLAILCCLLLSTGSRTPLIAITACLGWLLIAGNQKKTLIVIGLAALGMIVAYIFNPELLTQRGVSFRPEIWSESLRQIGEHPGLAMATITRCGSSWPTACCWPIRTTSSWACCSPAGSSACCYGLRSTPWPSSSPGRTVATPWCCWRLPGWSSDWLPASRKATRSCPAPRSTGS